MDSTRKNPFKELKIPERNIPKGLNKKIMTDINLIRLITDITALFTSNYTFTFGQIIKTNKNKPTS